MKDKVCSSCSKPYTIGNSFHKLCATCNQKRLSQGKVKKAIVYKPKKATGEGALFMEIWNTRKHYCEHCGDYLGEEPCAQYFAHIKPKSTYPELRLNPDNIRLFCGDCHYAHDFMGKEAFEKRKKPR